MPLSPTSTRQGDAVVEPLDRLDLDCQVELELLGHGLADAHRVQPLHVRHAFEEQDPLDDLVGVLHLVDRLVAMCSASRS